MRTNTQNVTRELSRSERPRDGKPTVRLLRRGRRGSFSAGSHLLHLRAMTDRQLLELRIRAVSFLLNTATPKGQAASDKNYRAQQLLEWVLGEQRMREWIASLPNSEDAMDMHRRTDAELLDEGKRALVRFRNAYGVQGDLSFSARMESARQVNCIQGEWANRHPGVDLIAVLARTALGSPLPSRRDLGAPALNHG